MAGEAIFIGYRRDDTADVAGRIFDAMALRFGKQRVFKDVDNIGPGVDFGDYIKAVLPRCRVALVLIGSHWLDSKDESGRRRIDDEHDWVRIEIETALATRGLLAVPVLVNGARMPRSDDVPASLQPLLRRNAAIIRRDPDFHDDVERLAAAIRSSVNTGILDLSKIGGKAPAAPHERKSRAPMFIGGAIAAVALLAVGYGAWRFLPPLFAGDAASVAEPEGANLNQPGSGEQGEEGDAQSTTDNPTSSVTSAVGRAEEETPQTPNATTTSPVQARVDEPVRAPLPASALPEMVRIPGRNFEVGRYEVTFAQWDACVAGGGCNGYRPSDEGWGRGNRPVINVSWNDAQAYVQWLSLRTGQRYRLLTSAEWEIAARAGTTTTRWWGDQDPVCERGARNGAQTGHCTPRQTAPIGSFQANEFGLFDVHGNVSEWVEDCYRTEPMCSDRMYRDGSWYGIPQNLGSALWFGSAPSNRNINMGFRVARTPN